MFLYFCCRDCVMSITKPNRITNKTRTITGHAPTNPALAPFLHSKGLIFPFRTFFISSLIKFLISGHAKLLHLDHQATFSAFSNKKHQYFLGHNNFLQVFTSVNGLPPVKTITQRPPLITAQSSIRLCLSTALHNSIINRNWITPC